MLKLYGSDLKRLRELKGVSLAEISAETRINTKFLNLMESGVFNFQPDTYIRSFLKEYARAIDEDEKRILNDYDKAKAGFYAARKFEKDDSVNPLIAVNVKATPLVTKSEKTTEPVYQKNLSQEKPDYLKPRAAPAEPEYSNKSVTRKVLLGLLILAIITSIYFLVDYLNNAGGKKSDVIPKSFNEISSDYENKLTGTNDSLRALDSLKKLSADSLRLVIKAVKDIRVIVVTDDDTKKIDEELNAKDSLKVTAGSKFRFSTTDGLNTEIYLNGKYLKKPYNPQGGSIKDLIITKEGIVIEKQP